MNDFSDLIFLTGAIVLFSILSLTVNKTMLMNDKLRTGTEVEYYGLTVAQEIVGEIRMAGSLEELEDYVDNHSGVADYYPDASGENPLSFDIDIEMEQNNLPSDDIDTYEITVEVSSEYFTTSGANNSIALSLSRSFR